MVASVFSAGSSATWPDTELVASLPSIDPINGNAASGSFLPSLSSASPIASQLSKRGSAAGDPGEDRGVHRASGSTSLASSLGSVARTKRGVWLSVVKWSRGGSVRAGSLSAASGGAGGSGSAKVVSIGSSATWANTELVVSLPSTDHAPVNDDAGSRVSVSALASAAPSSPQLSRRCPSAPPTPRGLEGDAWPISAYADLSAADDITSSPSTSGGTSGLSAAVSTEGCRGCGGCGMATEEQKQADKV